MSDDWQSITDTDLTSAQAGAATAVRDVAEDCGAALASTNGYSDDEKYLGGVTVAKVYGRWIAIAVDASTGSVVVAEEVQP